MRAGSGAMTRAGRTAKAASSGVRPEISWNQTCGQGRERDQGEARRGRQPEDRGEAAQLREVAVPLAHEGDGGVLKASPTDRKMNDRTCTTGKTASDSTGRRKRPMKNVSMGCTVSPMRDVSASG